MEERTEMGSRQTVIPWAGPSHASEHPHSSSEPMHGASSPSIPLFSHSPQKLSTATVWAAQVLPRKRPVSLGHSHLYVESESVFPCPMGQTRDFPPRTLNSQSQALFHGRSSTLMNTAISSSLICFSSGFTFLVPLAILLHSQSYGPQPLPTPFLNCLFHLGPSRNTLSSI